MRWGVHAQGRRLLAGVLVPPVLPVLHHRGWVSARWTLEAPWTWLAF